jgi:hypothetical protein
MTEHTFPEPYDPDIGYLDQLAYLQGRDPIDWAADKAREYIDVHLQVWGSRLVDPSTFPIYCIPLTTEALANRIVGGLLEAGWTPPPPPPGAERGERP